MRLKAVLLALFCVAASPLAHADWPEWRGPSQQGLTDAKLPLHWSETENVTWKTEIHDVGHSTPVVLGSQVWLTTAKQDGTVLYAVCLDANTGAITHDVAVLNIATPQNINPANSHATPSPVIEAGRVYVHYGSAGTAAVDTATGKVLWTRTDLNCDHMQGPASSPLLFEDLLILHLEGTDKQFIAALNKNTGETVWTYHRPADLYTDAVKGVYKKSYQTPVLVNAGGQPQLLSNGALIATAHDPRTGNEIWRVRYKEDSTISRIVWGNGLYFINTGGNPNGTELWAVREGGKGDITDTHVAWKMTKDAPHESSPVLVGDLLYTMSERSNLICAEAATGTQLYTQRLPGDFWASLLATKDRIYLPNRKGATTVVATGREYKELAVNNLDGDFLASPAVVGNALILRTKTHVYRVEEKK